MYRQLKMVAAVRYAPNFIFKKTG